MSTEDFNKIIDEWAAHLQSYDLNQILASPPQGGWSIGQLYIHLIDATNYQLEQAKICLSNNENKDKETSPQALPLFLSNEFPDIIIEGPASNKDTSQPAGKEEISAALSGLKRNANEVMTLINSSSFNGKTKHPGLGYFNAAEWFQLSEMHLRHHLRQKRRIDNFFAG